LAIVLIVCFWIVVWLMSKLLWLCFNGATKYPVLSHRVRCTSDPSPSRESLTVGGTQALLCSLLSPLCSLPSSLCSLLSVEARCSRTEELLREVDMLSCMGAERLRREGALLLVLMLWLLLWLLLLLLVVLSLLFSADANAFSCRPKRCWK
jgi:hypothetical protein